MSKTLLEIITDYDVGKAPVFNGDKMWAWQAQQNKDKHFNAQEVLSMRIKALFLELIGEDETSKWQGLESESARDEHRNGLRKELRDKINQL